MLDEALGGYLFPEKVDETGKDPRICPKCTEGRLHLKLSKFGGFIGCSRYPECDYTRTFTQETQENSDDASAKTQELVEPRPLGTDPKTGDAITVRKGPYGFYLQWGEGTKEKKPKRAPLPKGKNPLEITLTEALELTALPKNLGLDPETQEDISIGQGRFGPYVKYGKSFASIPKGEDPLEITLERALEIVAIAKVKAAAKEKNAPKATVPEKKESKTTTPRKKTAKKTS
jgi:DNA topoisomerase-1